MESALIEGSVLDAVYSRQKKERTDFCVKMYSHFNLNGKDCVSEVLVQSVAVHAVRIVSYSNLNPYVVLQLRIFNFCI